MKSVIIILLISVFSVTAIAQPSITARATYIGTYNQLWVTNSTPSTPIYPITIGGITDSLLQLIIAVRDTAYGISASTGSLQAACTIGNTTNTPLISSYGGYTGNFASSYFDWYNGSIQQGYLGNIFGAPVLQLKDYGSANIGTIQTGVLTGGRGICIPDEGNGRSGGLASQIVLHTTKSPLTITYSGDSSYLTNTQLYTGNYSGNGVYGVSQFMLYRSGVPYIGGTVFSGKPAYIIKDIYSNYSNAVVANILDSSAVDTLPLKSGTLATLQDVANGGGMLGLDGVLTNNPTSNKTAFFGKATGLNPYSSAYIGLNNDSSGDIGIQDTFGYQSFEIGKIYNSLCLQTTHCDSSLHLNGAWIITPPNNTSVITLPQNINGQLAQIDSYILVGSDANYTATNANEFINLLPSITATRTLSIPQGQMGQHMTIKVLNITGSFNWNISVTGGGNINDHDGSTITSLSHETVYTLYATGSSGNWMIVNKY